MIDRDDASKAVERMGMFTARGGRTLVDVFISNHPHFHEMRERRQQRTVPSGAKLWFISAEDLCVMKLLYARTKDVADLERMFAALPELDLAYVRSWLGKLPVGERHFGILDDLERRFRA